MKAAIGSYINFFTEDGKKDVFIILNEYNGQLTPSEYVKIETVFDKYIDNHKEINISDLEINIEYLTNIGVQVIVKRWED